MSPSPLSAAVPPSAVQAADLAPALAGHCWETALSRSCPLGKTYSTAEKYPSRRRPRIESLPGTKIHLDSSLASPFCVSACSF